MSDFYQQGLICTLQRLGNPGAPHLEEQLMARSPAISLVLPCHYSELGQPALERVLQEISSLGFLREIIVSMNGAPPSNRVSLHANSLSVQKARDYFSRIPQSHRILWNDAPEVRELLEARGIPFSSGKGFNYWAACGLILKEGISQVIVSQDCDVSSFDREMLIRICAAAALNDLDYDFAKMYYSRSTDRIHGRVSRLFLAPLLRSLIRVVGHHPLLDFLLSFRYPLAGEFAVRRELAHALAIPTGWGLEVGLLCEVFRHTDPRRVCQVDAGSNYEHKHQPLGSIESGLLKMVAEIATTLFHYLALEGLTVDGSFHQAVCAIYPREAEEAMRRYRNLALINGLAFGAAQEEAAVAGFSQILSSLSSGEPPSVFLPAWRKHLHSDWSEAFFNAIDCSGGL